MPRKPLSQIHQYSAWCNMHVKRPWSGLLLLACPDVHELLTCMCAKQCQVQAGYIQLQSAASCLCMDQQYRFEVRVWDAGQQENVDGDRLSTELTVL